MAKPAHRSQRQLDVNVEPAGELTNNDYNQSMREMRDERCEARRFLVFLLPKCGGSGVPLSPLVCFSFR
jgi:hypothetical protein